MELRMLIESSLSRQNIIIMNSINEIIYLDYKTFWVKTQIRAAVELLNAIGIEPSRIAIIPVCIQLLTQTPKPQAQVIQPTTEVAPPKLQQEEILMIG